MSWCRNWRVFDLGSSYFQCISVKSIIWNRSLKEDQAICFYFYNLINVYQSIVEPYLDYCSVVWDDISDQLTDKLQILQNRTARVITGIDYRMPPCDLLSKLNWPSLKEKRNKQNALMMFKIMNGMTPAYLEDIFTRNIGRSVYNLRISRRNLYPTGT